MKGNKMAVNSVNGNNNTALYTTIGATAGAGAGVAAGYLTRPFLKDGAPTDEFVKKLEHKLETSDSPELKAGFAINKENQKEVKAIFDRAKDPEELKGLLIDKLMKDIKEFEDAGLDIDTFKKFMGEQSEFLKGIGIMDASDIEKLQNIEEISDLRGVFKESFDKAWQGKTVEEIKNSMLSKGKEADKKAAKYLFESVWDTKEKKFVNCEDGVGKAIKDAARSIQGKYALIYGAIGAAVLGLGTYLFAHGKSSKTDVVESQSAK